MLLRVLKGVFLFYFSIFIYLLFVHQMYDIYNLEVTFIKEIHVRREIYTVTLGFSLGIFTCYFSNYISDSHSENLDKINSADGALFLSNVQTNVSEDDGGFFTPSPQVVESIIVDDFQDI
jgi:hypothetical protein